MSSTVIHHGTTSQGSTPPLTITAGLKGEFGTGNPSAGNQLYTANGNINQIRHTDATTNMPNSPPILAGSTYVWQDALIIDVTGVSGSVATWNGSPTDPNFTWSFTATEQQFVDVCNNWAVGAFNLRATANLSVTFASGGFLCNTSPAVGSFSPPYTVKLVVTENSSGRSGQVIFPTIRFENQTFAV